MPSESEPMRTQNRAQRLSDPALTAPNPPPGPGEVAIITLMGVVSLCGLMMVGFSFIPPVDMPGDLATLLWGFGPIAAGAGSAAMLWFRDRRKPASAMLVLAVVAWILGTNLLGFGGFGAFSPESSKAFLENLGFAVTLCGMPGIFLTALGAILYRKDRNRPPIERAGPQQAAPKPEAVARWERQLRRARDYVAQIESLVAKNKRLLSAAQEEALTGRLRDWQDYLQQLVDRLLELEDNPLIQEDRRDVPAAIARLEGQLAAETDPDMRREIQETLDGYRRQMQELDILQTLMRRTELDLEESLAAVGTIHSQLHTLQAKDINSQRVSRLSADISEQSTRLDDLLQAVDEAYQQLED